MDLTLDILIKKSDINRLNISEIFKEWGGEKLSQEPKKYIYKSSLVFRECNDMTYYKRILSDDFNLDDFLMLILEGESLNNLEFDVNSESGDEYKSDVISFIRELYKSLDVFYINKLIDDEKISDIHSINDVDEAIQVFLSSLNLNSPKGIIIVRGSIANCRYV